MGIDWPPEKEQARRTGCKWYGDCDQYALTRCQHSTGRTEGDAAWHIGKSEPVEVALITRPGNDPRETDERPIPLAIQMSNDTHRSWSQIQYGWLRLWLGYRRLRNNRRRLRWLDCRSGRWRGRMGCGR